MRGYTVILALFCLLLAAPMFGGHNAAAQLDVQFDEQPVLFSADEITYDQKLGVVVAKGNVEIEQAGRVLLADTVTYNQRDNSVIASGNVSLLEPSGEVIFAEYVDLRDNLKEGIVRQIRVLLTDDSRLAASGGRRSGGNTTRMTKAVYSPCKVCEDNPEKSPLWQLKAAEIIHDQESREIRYKHARLEMWGVPVLYTPYFEHPDPTVKRKTGFLVPSFKIDNNLGTKFVAPFYWEIAKDKDVTFFPIYTTKQGPVGAFEYRQRLNFGSFVASGSLTRSNSEVIDGRLFEDRWRGHIFGQGRFDITDTWRTGFDVERASDRTYLQRYDFSHTQTLTSNAFLEGFRRRDYAAVNLYAFQGLRVEDSVARSPLVLPFAEYQHVGEPGRFGGRWQLDANVLHLLREEGAISRRLSAKVGWHLPYTSPFGDVTQLSATLQGDVYHTSTVPKPTEPGELAGFTGRVFPQLGAHWRYPFIRHGGSFQQILEPVAAAFLAPGGQNDDLIPNEDSQDLEFDDTNLFSANRFTGIDRMEGGLRAVIGARFGLYHDGGGFGTVFFGQSIRYGDDGLFPAGSGIGDTFSDYVGRIELSPHPWFDLVQRFRLDKDDLSIRRNEISLYAGAPIFNVGARYIFIDGIDSGESVTEAFADREEVSGTVSSTLGTEYWRFRGKLLHDLSPDGGWLNYGAGLTYQDECFGLDLDWTRVNTTDADIRSGNTVFIRLTYKHLGEVAGGL